MYFILLENKTSELKNCVKYTRESLLGTVTLILTNSGLCLK